MDYYAKGYTSWIGLLQSLDNDEGALRVFGERYRARLRQLAAAGLCSNADKLNGGLDTPVLDEWTHFLEGTYGLCTKTGLPEDITAKELACVLIHELIDERGQQALSMRERICLTLAVDLLYTCSAAFAPHERERSSRQRLIDQVRRDYQLSPQRG